MKVLWLGNSDDVGLAAARQHRGSVEVAQRLLKQDFGEDVEFVGRVIWPSPELPDLVGEWMLRFEPDVVMFKVNGYWYLYPSVPLRLERALGRVVGGSLAGVGQKTAEIPWLAHTAAYRAARHFARRTVGSATYFTPEETVDVVERSARRILQHEQAGLVVWSPLGGWEGAPKGAAEHVFDKLEAFCAQLGLLHVAWDPATPDPTIHMFQSGDRIHRDDEGHRWYGALEARALQAAWRAATSGEPVPPFSFASEVYFPPG